jgi:hypothetical protein
MSWHPRYCGRRAKIVLRIRNRRTLNPWLVNAGTVNERADNDFDWEAYYGN